MKLLPSKPAHTKWACGHGGIGCPCCVIARKSDHKKGAARHARRAARQLLKREAS